MLLVLEKVGRHVLLVLEKDVTFSFAKVLKHTGSSVRCGDITDNLCVDERSRECDVQGVVTKRIPGGRELALSLPLRPKGSLCGRAMRLDDEVVMRPRDDGRTCTRYGESSCCADGCERT